MMQSGGTLGSIVSRTIVLALCAAQALGAAEGTNREAGAGVRVAQPETLTTEDSLSVNALFYPAGSASAPAPAVVLVHGIGQSGVDWSGFPRDLGEHGIATLSIDLRPLDGQSAKDALLLATNDIRAGIRFVREREDLDGVRVAVIGAGVGADLAAQYAVDDHLLACLAMLSPMLDQKGLRTDDAVAGFGKRAVFLAGAEGDSPSAQALPVLETKAVGTTKVIRVSGASSGIALLNDFRVRAGVLSWLDGIFKAQ
jgi:dienelactone hydrolase